jgi:hypothetical protein
VVPFVPPYGARHTPVRKFVFHVGVIFLNMSKRKQEESEELPPSKKQKTESKSMSKAEGGTPPEPTTQEHTWMLDSTGRVYFRDGKRLDESLVIQWEDPLSRRWLVVKLYHSTLCNAQHVFDYLRDYCSQEGCALHGLRVLLKDASVGVGVLKRVKEAIETVVWGKESPRVIRVDGVFPKKLSKAMVKATTELLQQALKVAGGLFVIGGNVSDHADIMCDALGECTNSEVQLEWHPSAPTTQEVEAFKKRVRPKKWMVKSIRLLRADISVLIK